MLSGIVKLCFSYSVRLLWRCRCQCRYHSIPFHAISHSCFGILSHIHLPGFIYPNACTAKIENYDWNQWWECPWGNNTHHIFVDIFFRRLLLISFCQPNNPISHNSHAHARARRAHTYNVQYIHKLTNTKRRHSFLFTFDFGYSNCLYWFYAFPNDSIKIAWMEFNNGKHTTNVCKPIIMVNQISENCLDSHDRLQM